MANEENNGEVLIFLLKRWNVKEGNIIQELEEYSCANPREVIEFYKIISSKSKDDFMRINDFCSWVLCEPNSSSIKGRNLLLISAFNKDEKLIHVFSVEEFIRFLRMFAIGDDDGGGNDMSLVKKDLTENDLRSFLKKENEEVDSFIKNFGGTY